MKLNLETEELKTLLPHCKVTDDYIAFFSDKSVFSNGYDCEFNYDDKGVRSAQQALVYGKALLLGDYSIAEKVLDTKNTPMAYHNLNKQINGDVNLWENYRSRVMISILDDKFNDSERLYLLKATGNRKLLLASPYDSIWGIGAGLSKVDTVWDSYTGKNLLGESLMKVRNNNYKSWPVFTAQTQEADIYSTSASYASLLSY
ncbi:hypothetical protein HOS78_gp077 [Lactobacillus phage Bacchae]|uniref:NADAR domain-containing protein n=1 Tax=Lactobacillus phage Bacchae TaxID=2079429 RepID=A0A2K9VCQ5_9CAUD|nr:hypothetical protein HOS78_gp077 [Lactobacillus phage Bacchae]AUV60013.1 hypothetical protein [Lactobacillus phage Bacchae]